MNVQDELQIPLEKVCDLIIASLALNASNPFEEVDLDNIPPIDEDMEFNVLENEELEELKTKIDELNEEEKINLVALVWVGRGSFSADEWEDALEEARDLNPARIASYLVSINQLGDYLEEGLAELGFPSEEFETGVR
ncbi:MAG: DUF3775 domain-containing protein [Sneathiella sp.]|nr:DUF3775 domain-containing protein [Sneathiella sp.]